ncbi:hypothetical protein HN51_012229 [Arachis hypogaea]
MRNGSSRRDLLLNSQSFFRSIPAGAENPSLSRLCYRRLWGSRNRRALILGWAYYLDAFSSYPLRTWLPSIYRGHDNWHTRAQPLEHTITPGGEEPTSRCQTFPSIQAPFYLCTRGPISVWPEETFARLRYLLGGLRPNSRGFLNILISLSRK